MVSCPSIPAVRRAGVRGPGALAVLALGLVLGGCSARTLSDFSPEIQRDRSGAPLPVVLELKDLRARPPIVFILTNPAGTARLRQGRRRLPLAQKEIDDERMGRLLAYLRHRGFFRYAVPAGDPPAALPAGARRTLSLAIGKRPLERMIDVRGMGTAGRRDEVQAMTEMAAVVRRVSNQTISLKVDPRGRSAADLLHQPGLRRRGAR